MARWLDKIRMRDTGVLIALAIAIGLFTHTPVKNTETLRAAFFLLGFALVAACALGRIYACVSIGGAKGETLVTHGAYALCRNPLYFFSVLGAMGVGMMSGSLLAFLAVTAGFLLIYDRRIEREEEDLKRKFGKDFDAFAENTPRLLPGFRNQRAPEELVFRSRHLRHALRDAAWCFAPVIVFEGARVMKKYVALWPSFPLF